MGPQGGARFGQANWAALTTVSSFSYRRCPHCTCVFQRFDGLSMNAFLVQRTGVNYCERLRCPGGLTGKRFAKFSLRSPTVSDYLSLGLLRIGWGERFVSELGMDAGHDFFYALRVGKWSS